jgi:hypothetical protein
MMVIPALVMDSYGLRQITTVMYGLIKNTVLMHVSCVLDQVNSTACNVPTMHTEKQMDHANAIHSGGD